MYVKRKNKILDKKNAIPFESTGGVARWKESLCIHLCVCVYFKAIRKAINGRRVLKIRSARDRDNAYRQLRNEIAYNHIFGCAACITGATDLRHRIL